MNSDVFKAYLEKYLPEVLEKLIRYGKIEIPREDIKKNWHPLKQSKKEK